MPPAPPTPAPPPPTAPPPGAGPRIALRNFTAGLDAPLGVVHAGDGSGRLFLVEQAGRILVWRNGTVLPAPFLDLTALVLSGGERGLLGLAFAPDYRSSGRFYVDYTDLEGDTVVARYRADPADPDRADPATAEAVLRVEQPYANHNGGQLAFGPDGMLYVALGDGGYGSDPHGHGQNPRTLLGSILRLDVRGPSGYASPEDNPFAARGTRPGEGAPEVWAYGLRNPWRFSFDRLTGDLYIADVGQREVEEVDFVPAGAAGGWNFGWNVWEGSQAYTPDVPENVTNGPATFPVAEYTHRPGGHCSITGGFVYRGAEVPALRGTYLFGDYCSGMVWGLTRAGEAWAMQALLDTGLRISTFGEDEAGELYVADLADGAVHRVVAGP